jgi:hypothetical protein
MTIAGAFLCVLRARFFRFEVRRFGTAIEYSSIAGGVFAGALVQITATGRTKPLAIGAAEHERGDLEEPLLTERGTQVDFVAAASIAQRKDIGIVVTFNLCFGIGEQEMRVGADLGAHFDQAAPAFSERGTRKPSAEIEPTRSCRGEPSRNLEGTCGSLIAFKPDLVVGVEIALDLNRLDGQCPRWKRQHNFEIYPVAERRATWGRIMS